MSRIHGAPRQALARRGHARPTRPATRHHRAGAAACSTRSSEADSAATPPGAGASSGPRAIVFREGHWEVREDPDAALRATVAWTEAQPDDERAGPPAGGGCGRTRPADARARSGTPRATVLTTRSGATSWAPRADFKCACVLTLGPSSRQTRRPERTRAPGLIGRLVNRAGHLWKAPRGARISVAYDSPRPTRPRRRLFGHIGDSGAASPGASGISGSIHTTQGGNISTPPPRAAHKYKQHKHHGRRLGQQAERCRKKVVAARVQDTRINPS